MPLNIDDDEYVAKLLAQDAKKTSKTYELVGLDAFNPKRSRTDAPKPNTSFLRHIIRQTDSHNAALLAKEAEESSLRLRQMNRGLDKDRTRAVDRAKKRIEGRLSPSADDSQDRRSERRNHHNEDRTSRRRDRSGQSRDGHSDSRSRQHRDRSRTRHRHEMRHEASDEDRSSQKSKQLRESRKNDHRQRHDNHERDRKSYDRSHRRRRSSRTRSRSRSTSPPHKSRRNRNRSRSPRRSPRRLPHSPQTPGNSRRRSHSPASDSDPLEAIVGPLPPPPEATVRSRGRGAIKANSQGIESRFSTNYDPSMDMRPGSDVEDEWGEALEVMRDRERWRQQGADRLRAAGFKTEQVKRWEKGGDPLEEDVVWTKRGQDREWDRGKVVDGDGDVELRAEWGRLK